MSTRSTRRPSSAASRSPIRCVTRSGECGASCCATRAARSSTSYLTFPSARRQPGGCEGLRPFDEVLEPHDLSVAEGRDLVVQLFVDHDPAPFAAPAVAQPSRDTLAGIDELLGQQ